MNTMMKVQQLIPVWQAFQSLAPMTHIENDIQYEQMIALLNGLLDTVRDDNRHPLYSLIAVVGDLIETYEIEQGSKVAR